ncbi:hypothetical protein Q5752_002136 [Cryptotrichosporon argae]
MAYFILASIRAKNAEAADKLAEHLRAVKADVDANEPDTLLYHPTRDADDPLAFVVIEEYKDEAAQTKHREGKPYNAFKAELAELVEGSLSLQKLERI